ncbi:MAG: ABC transporter ATP-binding protein [Rhodobacteraceae bacterium]|nr:ABC transporter ATP-binding protein [Paracoccaceae bacterium]
MLLEVESITKSFNGAEGPLVVLDALSLGMVRGETLALTGESGSGKSTLLTLIAGLDRPERGMIRIDGQNLGRIGDTGRAALRRHTVGLVFQQFNLIPSLDVAANIAFQARLAGRHDSAWTGQVAARLGLTPLLRRYPEHLSGGQQQRVAIARTLAARPALMLADEPTGNLDEAASDHVLALMQELVEDSGTALLMATHSARLAARLSRRVHLSMGHLT